MPPRTSARRCESRQISFLHLPGEIRNQIYSHYFEDGLRFEASPPPMQERHPRPTITFLRPGIQALPDRTAKEPSDKARPRILTRTRQMRKPRYKEQLAPFHTIRWQNSLSALLLVCKQIYHETLEYHYKATTFHFATTRAVRGFFRMVPSYNLAFVRRLSLFHGAQGPSGEVWLERQWDETWPFLVKQIVELMPDVNSLSLSLYLTDLPFRHSLIEPYVLHLLPFGDLPLRADLTPAVTIDSPSDRLFLAHQVGGFVNWRLLLTREHKEARRKLSVTFGEAIRLKFLGHTNREAMADYRALQRQYDNFKFILELGDEPAWGVDRDF